MFHLHSIARAVALALAAALASPALADTAPAGADAVALAAPGPGMLPQFGEEIVVKGKRPPRLDTLEAREVRETSARDLGEALDAQAGVSKVRKGGIASDIVLRGMKKDDVNVTIDGAKVHGACPSRMDPPTFHLDYAEIDRVEVKKGPFDVRNPGGLGGLIDVRTRRAHPDLGSELNFEYGSFQSSQSSAVVSWAGERSDVQLGGAYKYGQPYLSGDGRNTTEAVAASRPDGTPNPARFRNTSDAQKAYGVGSGWGKLGFAPADAQRLEVSYTRQSATDVLYPYLLMDGIADTTDRVNAVWRAERAGPLTQALAQLYLSDVRHDMDDRGRCSSAGATGACSGVLPRAYGMRTEARARIMGGRLEAAAGDEARLLAGADFYLRTWDNTTTRVARLAPGQPYASEASVPDVRIGNVGLYAQTRQELTDRLALTAGGRLDLAATDARQDRSDLYRTFHPGEDVARSRTDLLLSGNAQLELSALEHAMLFAGYGHGSRVPDQQERYYALTGMTGNPAYVGFPGLKPVRSDELDAGVKWADGRWLAKAQAFHAWVGDDIVLTNVSVPGPGGGGALSAKTYANVDARIWGGEASARLTLPAHLFLSAGAAYTRGVDVTRGGDLAEIPPLKASVALRWDVHAFFAEAEEVYAARQDRVDVRLGEGPTPAWYITNLRAGIQYRGWKGFLGVRNVFDKLYVEHLGYLRDPFTNGTRIPEPGRSFYGSLQYLL